MITAAVTLYMLGDAALISTFTSTQERVGAEAALAHIRLFIHVCAQGIPAVESLSAEQQIDFEEKRLLLISPQPGASTLNKKVATLCNEYVLRQAVEIRVGDISPNGMLASLLESQNQEARA